MLVFKIHPYILGKFYAGQCCCRMHEVQGFHPGRDAGSSTSTMHAHAFIHAFTPRVNLSYPVHLPICFWEAGGNQQAQKKPPWTRGEHIKLHTGSKESSGASCAQE